MLESELLKKNVSMCKIIIGLPKRVIKLQNTLHENPNDRLTTNSDDYSLDNFNKRCSTLKSEMLAMRTSKVTRLIMFQELVIRSLG